MSLKCWRISVLFFFWNRRINLFGRHLHKNGTQNTELCLSIRPLLYFASLNTAHIELTYHMDHTVRFCDKSKNSGSSVSGESVKIFAFWSVKSWNMIKVWLYLVGKKKNCRRIPVDVRKTVKIFFEISACFHKTEVKPASNGTARDRKRFRSKQIPFNHHHQ